MVNIRASFINALIFHSGILLDFFHYCLITLFQAKKRWKRKNNIANNIAPLPRFIIMNVAYRFGEKFIGGHTSEFQTKWYAEELFTSISLYALTLNICSLYYHYH